ncbi:DUF3237 family protein [uncultured Cohaesibacter sp.]|uniref:DUF3237 family protein n=1 Tax=uncultured Cohaesibacter sp. TaxID=1002546 RepID=UPI0029C68725|nr:DUF3237 family protein [uncultured Cohaesibacter sp.]
MLSDETLLGALSEHGVQNPDLRFTWEAVVTVAPREDLGTTPLGQRFIIPITGGLFRGGAEHPDLKGIVLPRGADRQLLRADGVKQLSATYEMQVEDGTVLGIENEVVMDTEAQPKRYGRLQNSCAGSRGSLGMDEPQALCRHAPIKSAEQGICCYPWLGDPRIGCAEVARFI